MAENKLSCEWTVTLNTGATVPAFGLGTFQSEPNLVGKAVEIAVRAGYRNIDCAWIYQNEHEVGEAIEKLIKEGVVKREELFVTSKLWNAFHLPEDVEEGCRDSLKKLKLDYLDLFLVHGPSSIKKESMLKFPTPDEHKITYEPSLMAKTWEAMESLIPKGLVKAIGISNFTITKIENLLKTAKVVPAVNQVECHPYFQQPKLQRYCKSKGIIFEAYAPLGSPGRPRSSSSDPVVMDDPVIKEIATAHGATIGQICIAYLLHSGLMVIPKSTSEARIKENFASTKVSLSGEEMERLKGIDKNHRLFTGEYYLKSGVTVEQCWDVAADEAYTF